MQLYRLHTRYLNSRHNTVTRVEPTDHQPWLTDSCAKKSISNSSVPYCDRLFQNAGRNHPHSGYQWTKKNSLCLMCAVVKNCGNKLNQVQRYSAELSIRETFSALQSYITEERVARALRRYEEPRSTTEFFICFHTLSHV